MNQTRTLPSLRAETDGIEARFGLRMAALLNEQAQQTPRDISERLRVAREQALLRARSQRSLAGATVVAGQTGHAAVLGGGSPWFLRLASALPLVLLLAGLFAIDQWQDRAQVEATADIDIALLSDELPPAAYRDPGFVEFLKTAR
jgi:hypothetical protein